MAKRTSAAVDRLRARLVAEDEARHSQCSQAKQDADEATQLEEAWQAVQSSGDAQSVIKLAGMLKDFFFEDRLERVQDRAIAFAEAIEQEPSGDWRYPGLKAASAKNLEHATTMKALTAILLDAIAGRKPGTIAKSLKGLHWWERGPGWEILRGEMLFFHHFPIEPSRIAITSQTESHTDEYWGKRAFELYVKNTHGWNKTYEKMKAEGYKQSEGNVRNLFTKYKLSLSRLDTA